MGDAGFSSQGGSKTGTSKGVHVKTPDTPWKEEHQKGAYIILKVRGDAEGAIVADAESGRRINVAGRWVVGRYRFTVSQGWMQFVFPLCYSNRECALPPAFARDWTLTNPYENRGGSDGRLIIREHRRTKARIEE